MKQIVAYPIMAKDLLAEAVELQPNTTSITDKSFFPHKTEFEHELQTGG